MGCHAVCNELSVFNLKYFLKTYITFLFRYEQWFKNHTDKIVPGLGEGGKAEKLENLMEAGNTAIK